MKNKLALITGASSGIGYEIAKLHAARGGDVLLVARREELLREKQNEIASTFKVKAYALKLDVTESDADKKIFDFLESNNLKVDYFINNAGFGGAGKFADVDIERHIEMINLNIVAATRLAHAFVKYFRKNAGGKILNVGSTAGIIPGGPMQAVYCATKAYFNSLSRALYSELAGTNISVTLLSPGPTDTEFAKVANASSTKLFKSASSAYKVARDGYQGMLNDKLEVISGLALSHRILFKLMSFVPDKVLLNETKRMQSV